MTTYSSNKHFWPNMKHLQKKTEKPHIKKNSTNYENIKIQQQIQPKKQTLKLTI